MEGRLVSNFRIAEIYPLIFFKILEFPCAGLEGRGVTRPHPAPEANLLKTPTPLDVPGLAVAVA